VSELLLQTTRRLALVNRPDVFGRPCSALKACLNGAHCMHVLYQEHAAPTCTRPVTCNGHPAPCVTQVLACKYRRSPSAFPPYHSIKMLGIRDERILAINTDEFACNFSQLVPRQGEHSAPASCHRQELTIASSGSSYYPSTVHEMGSRQHIQ
jgi:hypothetical protein